MSLRIAIWNLNDGGDGAVQSNEGGRMISVGAPNDLLSHFNSPVVIVFLPSTAHFVHPFLERRKIRFRRSSRMASGFTLATISGVIGATA
jgi:proton-dependent oligopeptide transporter, POT family